MATRMQQRRGTASQWTTANPILAAGEIGFESDTNQFKIGDGINHWEDLSYFKNLEDLGGSLDDYILLTEKGNPDGVATLNSSGFIPLSQLPTGAALDAEVQQAVNDHSAVTTSVHGIADTAQLITRTQLDADLVDFSADTALLWQADIAESVSDSTALWQADIEDAITTHTSETENVHGIADTSLLATMAYTDAAVSALGDNVGNSLSFHAADTTSVHGIADTSLLVTTTGTQTLTNKTITSPAGLVKADVGLGNVDNTSDADKPVSTATETAIATAKSEAIAEVTAVIDSAPTALNTLNELAAALGDDENFASTVTTALDGKVASYTPIIQKTGSYTLSALSERDSLIEVSSSSAVTITIPANSAVAYPVGTSLDILQTSTGQVTIAGAGGVTVNATPGLKLRTQWSSATLFKRATDTWVVMGDLSA